MRVGGGWQLRLLPLKRRIGREPRRKAIAKEAGWEKTTNEGNKKPNRQEEEVCTKYRRFAIRGDQGVRGLGR